MDETRMDKEIVKGGRTLDRRQRKGRIFRVSSIQKSRIYYRIVTTGFCHMEFGKRMITNKRLVRLANDSIQPHPRGERTVGSFSMNWCFSGLQNEQRHRNDRGVVIAIFGPCEVNDWRRFEDKRNLQFRLDHMPGSPSPRTWETYPAAPVYKPRWVISTSRVFGECHS